MKHRVSLSLVLALVAAPIAVASGQYTDPEAPPPPPPPAGSAQPAPASNTAVAPPPPPPPPPPSNTQVIYTTQPTTTTSYRAVQRTEPRAEVSGFIGVPIYVTDPQNVTGPGVGLSGRYGWILNPSVVLQFGGGWQINWLDLSSMGGLDHVSFNMFYFNLGARFYVPLQGNVRPFVSANLDFNFWHLEGDTGVSCGGYYYWYCYSYNQYYYEPGVSGRVGVQIKLAPTAALEVGLRVGATFGTNFFLDPEAWLDPFLGFTAFM